MKEDTEQLVSPVAAAAAPCFRELGLPEIETSRFALGDGRLEGQRPATPSLAPRLLLLACTLLHPYAKCAECRHASASANFISQSIPNISLPLVLKL
jgi:hypothetical protein